MSNKIFMEVIVPIGISGSGKTRLYKMRYSHLTLVNTDFICKEVTGNINDYSKPNEVLNVIYKKVDELKERGESFFFDNTNLQPVLRKFLTDKFKGTDTKVIYVVMPANVEVSMERIKADIKNNIERPVVSHSRLIEQLHMYNYTLKTKFEGENVQEIIYLKQGELD